MKKTLIGGSLAIIAACIWLAAPASAADAEDSTQIYGPYASDSPDSGTCGNQWAKDAMDRVYIVNIQPNPDETYNVTQEFRDGTFTTLAGHSPGACETGSDNGQTVPADLSGTFQGSFEILVWNGSYDPAAACSAPCYTKDFVKAYFGPGAVYDIPAWNLQYDAENYGQWKNTSSRRGETQGDIYLAAGQTFTPPVVLASDEPANDAADSDVATDEVVEPIVTETNLTSDNPFDFLGRFSSQLLSGTLDGPSLLAAIGSSTPRYTKH